MTADKNRPSPPLPNGMSVTILSTTSRGTTIIGINSEELARVLGCDPSDHITMSDWSSINDSHFYAERESKFSYETAIAETAAMRVPRVVLHKIKDKSKKAADSVKDDTSSESSKTDSASSQQQKERMVKKKTTSARKKKNQSQD